MTTERATSNIPVETFIPGVHDPDKWFKTLEDGVDLATNTTGKADKYKKWARIKMDDATRMIFDECSQGPNVTWEALKKELKSKLVTPQQRYNWRMGRNRVVWDGRESFHVLAARIKSAVDMHEDNPRATDYFDNFRNALPTDYQTAIDFGNNGETLDEAKRIAFKYQATLAGQSQAGDTVVRGAIGGITGARTVGFVGASMDEDRLKAVEMAMKEMSLKMDNAAEERKDDLRVVRRSQTPGRSGYDYSRSPSPGYRGDSRDNRNWGGRGFRSPGGSRYERVPYQGDDRRYDQPRYNQPRYDQPRYDQPRYDQPRYDQPRYDQPRSGRDYDRSDRQDYSREREQREYRQDDRARGNGRDQDDQAREDQGRDGARAQNREGRQNRRGNSPANNDRGGPRNDNRGRQAGPGRNDDRREQRGGDARGAEFDDNDVDWFAAALVDSGMQEQVIERIRANQRALGEPKN